MAHVIDLVLAHPKKFLLGSLALSVVALALGLGVELRTSRTSMVDADDPDQARLDALTREFSGDNPLIVAVEARPGREVSVFEHRRATDAVAAALRDDPLVDHVFFRVDPQWFEDHALHLANPEEIDLLTEGLATLLGADPESKGPPTWATLDDALVAEMRTWLREGRSAPPSRRAAQFDRLSDLMGAQERFFADPSGTLAAWSGRSLIEVLGASDTRPAGGYLASKDGRALFLIVPPKSPDDDLALERAFVASVRQRTRGALAAWPQLTFGLTGNQAFTVDEMDVVATDTVFTSVVAGIGVGLLALLAFRFRAHAVLSLFVLGVGVLWSLAAVRLELGYLNLITSSFVSILIGVGIDYMIHPVSEYELEGAHEKDPRRALGRAMKRTLPAVVVSALTTAGAFFAILLMDYRGFAEMGLVAGGGVLLCLASSIFVLPPLLLLHGRWRARRVHARRGTSRRGLVDRWWVNALAPRICRHPVAVTVMALGVTIVALFGASGVDLDLNVFELIPKDTESRRYLTRLEHSDLAPHLNLVLAADVAELVKLAARAAQEPKISRVESALSLMPKDREATRAALAALARMLDRSPSTPGGAGLSATAASVLRVAGSLRLLAAAARAAGAEGGPVEELEGRVRALGETMRNATPERAATFEDAELRFSALVVRWLGELRAFTQRPLPSLEGLPEGLRGRFVTRSGKLVGYLYPEGDVFAGSALAEFNAASRRVSAETVGWPVLFEAISGRITRGFGRSFLLGGVLVLLTLLVGFRRIGPALWSLLPVALGMVWLLGLMRLLGLSFNLANLVAFPLILGVGIDNGVHLVHRWRGGGHAQSLVTSVGRAILLASLTTMVGFGSLALANHGGMSSLGLVLLLGVGSCLVTSLVVFPNLLLALGWIRSEGRKETSGETGL